MSGTIQTTEYEQLRKYTDRQTCVRALRRANLPLILKSEAEQFINRNILPDCGRVPPNCLKAFLIRTVNKMGLSNLVPYVKKMFRSSIGYNGYYLDAGNLRHVNLINDFR